MGKELPLARPEEKGQSMLLAITSSGEHIATPYNGDERTQKSCSSKGYCGGEAEDTKAKSQSSRKAERANASSSEKDRRRRGNKNRKSDRGDEGEDKLVGRSAQELGIKYPSSYCDKSEITPHYWVEVDRVDRGSLLQCKYCHDYLWLPEYLSGVERLNNLIRQYGKNEGYCHFLNIHRPAKVLIAKLQDLTRLEKEVVDMREFARMADKILSDKEYDKEE